MPKISVGFGEVFAISWCEWCELVKWNEGDFFFFGRHVIELISAMDSTHVIALLVKAHKFHCAIWINFIMLAERRCRVGWDRNKFSKSPDIRSFDLLLNGTFKHGFIFFSGHCHWYLLGQAVLSEVFRKLCYRLPFHGQYFMNIIFIDS